jgi:hypothetical protein
MERKMLLGIKEQAERAGQRDRGTLVVSQIAALPLARS